MQTVQPIDRCGVVIDTLGRAAPVSHHQIQVQESTLHLGFAVSDFFQGAFAEADG